MANIQPSVAGWSTTEASNQPDGTDTLTVAADMRAILAGVRYDSATRASITAGSTTDLSTITAGIVQVDNAAGTTTITALGTVSSGIKKFLVFNITGGSVSMTHNATSLILPNNGSNISVNDKDCALVESLGSGNWKMHYYSRYNGQSLGSTSVYDFAGTATNYTISATRGGSAETIALKTKAGTDPSASDPITINFRNVTAATGDYSTISITAATSIVISSGSTLGMANSVASRLWLVGVNDGGTFRLGIINGSVNEDQFYSSTAEGGAGAADSAGVLYTGTAVTSKAIRILGYLDYTLATVGTWNTAPTKIQVGVPAGGNVNQIDGIVSFTGDISPAQITSGQNDYSPTGIANATVLRLSSNASQNITGLAGGADGRVIMIHNVGAQNIVLVDESASSTAGNRFALTANVTLGADQCAVLQYDSTSSRWRALAAPGAATGYVSTDNGLNAVGSFGWCLHTTANTTITAGSTYSGSSLTSAGHHHSATGTGAALTNSAENASALSGTWRALGYCDARSGEYSVTLYQRIS